VYPIYEETNDFDGLGTAPPDMGGSYEVDSITSVFGDWYDYNGETHELTTRNHVYVLKLDSDSYFKLRITNFYKVIEDAPVSGWITIEYDEL